MLPLWFSLILFCGYHVLCFATRTRYRDQNLVPRPEHGTVTRTRFRDRNLVPQHGPCFAIWTWFRSRYLNRVATHIWLHNSDGTATATGTWFLVTVAEPVFIICLVPYRTVCFFEISAHYYPYNGSLLCSRTL